MHFFDKAFIPLYTKYGLERTAKGIKIGLNPIKTTIQSQQDETISSRERSIAGILRVVIKNKGIELQFFNGFEAHTQKP